MKDEGNALFKAGELAKARSKYARVFLFTKSVGASALEGGD